MLFRRVLAAAAALLGALAAAMAVVWGTSDQRIEQTIAEGARIDAVFRSAAAWIDDFRRRERRLPSAAEFDGWKAMQPHGAPSGRHLALVPPGDAGDLKRPFAAAPPGAYVLAYRHGDWSEYYASWIKASTLVLDKRSFHLTGSGLGDGALAAAVAAALLFIAARMWRKP